jgi:hypothetical protein
MTIAGEEGAAEVGLLLAVDGVEPQDEPPTAVTTSIIRTTTPSPTGKGDGPRRRPV